MGFVSGARCSYYRVTDDGVYQALIVELCSRGAGARVFVLCTVPDVVRNFDANKFPPADVPTVCGGEISSIASSFGKYMGRGYIADINSQDGIEKFFGSITPVIESCVIPFFEVRMTRKSFLDSIDEETKKRPEYQAFAKSVLA
jgi:hypothetical protein